VDISKLDNGYYLVDDKNIRSMVKAMPWRLRRAMKVKTPIIGEHRGKVLIHKHSYSAILGAHLLLMSGETGVTFIYPTVGP